MKVAFAAATLSISLLSGSTAAAQHRIPLADVKSVDPTIVVELRYAGSNNITGRPLYAHATRAFVRPELLSRLKDQRVAGELDAEHVSRRAAGNEPALVVVERQRMHVGERV